MARQRSPLGQDRSADSCGQEPAVQRLQPEVPTLGLVSLWKESRSQLDDKHLQQIIAFAGDGRLRDGGKTSEELRSFLPLVSSMHMERYANDCLQEGFPGSGLALQDIVNELGRRLGFDVRHGRYRGTPGQSGHDGLWGISDGRALVVEVKTTDAYRIDLNTIANYKRQLGETRDIDASRSSILIIVGRQDTGDLEAQIRGSRFAWDVRVISVDALLRMVKLKEEVEDPKTIRRMHDVLFPREFTRLDEIVELAFSTVADATEEVEDEDDDQGKEKRFKPSAFHAECVKRIEASLGAQLVKQTKTAFSSPDQGLALVCAVSRTHSWSRAGAFWFAFHPHQREFLGRAKTAYVAFGCGSPETVILFPAKTFLPWLDRMNVTKKEERTYWHVKIYRDGDRLLLVQTGDAIDIDVTPYRLPA